MFIEYYTTMKMNTFLLYSNTENLTNLKLIKPETKGYKLGTQFSSKPGKTNLWKWVTKSHNPWWEGSAVTWGEQQGFLRYF